MYLRTDSSAARNTIFKISRPNFMPKRLCLILDLNGTLLYRSTQKLPNLQHDLRVNGKYIYFRPHLFEFFEFLAEHRDTIELGIWTSMTPKNAYEIVSHLWKRVFLPSENATEGSPSTTLKGSKFPLYDKDACQWREPFLTDEGFLEDTLDTQLVQLYHSFIGQPLKNKTPVSIRFLFTQENCLSRRKDPLLDAACFREFKPVMFKHLPILWNQSTGPLSGKEVEKSYGKATILAGGKFALKDDASFTANAFKFPKLRSSPVIFPQSRILLLEDSYYKFLATPQNGLVIPEYCPADHVNSSTPLLSGNVMPACFPIENVLVDLMHKLRQYLQSDLAVADLLKGGE